VTDTALLDIDGTLVDSNYQHVLAWQCAFREHGLSVGAWRIHRHIGMGGDQLVPALVGEDLEGEHGDGLRAAWRECFDPMLGAVKPIEGATELMEALRGVGIMVVLASSGPGEHVERYVDLVRARGLAAAWTASDDVETTKPAPDLLEVALREVGGSDSVTIGDSTWDCQAARRLGGDAVAVRIGGFCRDELYAAGARDVYDSLPLLTAALTQGRPPSGRRWAIDRREWFACSVRHGRHLEGERHASLSTTSTTLKGDVWCLVQTDCSKVWSGSPQPLPLATAWATFSTISLQRWPTFSTWPGRG
jgi:phosphoglycolate phosphatase-like HAD superfamily hydrolase